MDIAQSLDYEVEGTLIIAHLPQQVHHFWNEVAPLAYFIGLPHAISAPAPSTRVDTDLLWLVVGASPQEVRQSRWCKLRVQFELR